MLAEQDNKLIGGNFIKGVIVPVVRSILVTAFYIVFLLENFFFLFFGYYMVFLEGIFIVLKPNSEKI